MSYPLTHGCWYGDDMVGAPVLSGFASNYEFINLLDKCLNTGFNTNAVQTLSRTDTTATATYASPPGYKQDQIIDLAGVNESGWSDRYRIIEVPTPSTLKFSVPVGLAAAPTGNPVTLAAPAWKNPVWSGNVKSYTDTGKAVFNIIDPAGSGYSLRVVDTYGKYAKIRGYKVMTAIDTGTGPFPDLTSVTDDGLFVYKSYSTDATARRWRVIADSRFLMFFVIGCSDTAYGNVVEAMWFSDLVPLSPQDTDNCIIAASQQVETYPNDYNNTSRLGYMYTSSYNNGCWISSNYVKKTPSLFYKYGPMESYYGSSATMGQYGYTYPLSITNSLILKERVRVSDGRMDQGLVTGMRGFLPGIFAPLSNYLKTPDAFTTITLQGIPYLVIKDNYTSSKQHWYLVKMVGDLRV